MWSAECDNANIFSGYGSLPLQSQPLNPQNCSILLNSVVTLGDPQQYQFEYCFWKLGIICTMLKRCQGIELGKSGVNRLLRHLGLCPQIPKYKRYKQTPRKLRCYLQETFSQVLHEAQRTGAVIYFLDEVAVHNNARRSTTWAAVVETPVVQDNGDRFGLRLISAVSPRRDLKFAAFDGYMTSERFIDFLKKLRADTGKPIIVIADNTKFLKNVAAKRYLRPSAEGIRIEHLQNYATELNPDEQARNHLKDRLGKMIIESKEQMKQEVKCILPSIQRSVNLVLSFFQLKDTQYALNAT